MRLCICLLQLLGLDARVVRWARAAHTITHKSTDPLGSSTVILRSKATKDLRDWHCASFRRSLGCARDDGGDFVGNGMSAACPPICRTINLTSNSVGTLRFAHLTKKTYFEQTVEVAKNLDKCGICLL